MDHGRYAVVAPLWSPHGGPVYACYAMPAVYPPSTCSGVVLKGIDLRQSPESRRLPSGLWTPIMRVEGTWDGHVLILTRPPQTVESQTTTTTEPVSRAHRPPPPVSEQELLDVHKRIRDDWKALADRGMPVFTSGVIPTRGVVKVVVPVADATTVDYFEKRYIYVDVYGWLQPVS